MRKYGTFQNFIAETAVKSKDSLDDVHGKINFDLKIPLKYGTMYSMKDSKPDEKVTLNIK